MLSPRFFGALLAVLLGVQKGQDLGTKSLRSRRKMAVPRGGFGKNDRITLENSATIHTSLMSPSLLIPVAKVRTIGC